MWAEGIRALRELARSGQCTHAADAHCNSLNLDGRASRTQRSKLPYEARRWRSPASRRSVGRSSIRIGQPFERYFRNVHVLLEDSDRCGARYASAGRLMFGLENDWVWLSFRAPKMLAGQLVTRIQ